MSGPGHFRGARRVSPPLQDDDVDAEEEEAAAEACCCLAHSPPLNSHPTSGRDEVKRRRRWYFRVALPEPRAQPRPLPPPLGGTWRTPDSPAGQRPARLVFLRLKLGRRERSGAPPPGFLLPSGPEAATYPTVTWNPGTQVPIRIIVALLPDGPGARCPSAVAAAVPVSGGGDGQDLTREEAAPAPRSAAGSRRCRAARTRRWGEAGA